MLNIKVIGSGCATCQRLESLCKEVTTENNLDAQIEKITDINKFAELGVFITPGLIVNNKLLNQGKLPTKSTLTHWLNNAVNK